MTTSDSNNVSTNLEVVTQTGTSPEIVSMLEQTIFGTKGKVRYRQKHIAKGMISQKNLEFIQIKKSNRILGTTGVVSRETATKSKPLKSLYIRYLSVLSSFQNKGTIRKASSSARTGKLRTMIGELITNHFEKPVTESGNRAVFYAFVESENYNSKQLCISLGFYPTRKVYTLLYSRMYPHKSSDISVSKPEDHALIREELGRFYKEHAFYFEDRLFDEGSYYVFRKDGKIIGGVRARPINWEIIEVPGFNGFLMQKILPYLPLTKRLFNPKDMNFLAFDYLWHADKEQDVIPELLEHACADQQIHMGMLWGDTEDLLSNYLIDSGKLGFLHRVQGAVTAEVMMRFINSSEEKSKVVKRSPVFVSAMDMT